MMSNSAMLSVTNKLFGLSVVMLNVVMLSVVEAVPDKASQFSLIFTGKAWACLSGAQVLHSKSGYTFQFNVNYVLEDFMSYLNTLPLVEFEPLILGLCVKCSTIVLPAKISMNADYPIESAHEAKSFKCKPLLMELRNFV